MFKHCLLFLSLAVLAFLAVSEAKCPSEPFFKIAPSPIRHAKDLPKDELAYHNSYMQIALDAIRQVPNGKFGAAIVAPNGTVACTGTNQGTKNRLFHGEIVAINNCSAIHGKNTWEGYTIYTTGEPCVMCQAGIMWTKFKRVVFGSYVSNIYCERCAAQLPVGSNVINGLGYGINHYTEIIGGVMEKDCDALMTNVCGKGEPTTVVPICKLGWQRKCEKKSNYFGNYESDSE
eukprot:gene3171-3970_t